MPARFQIPRPVGAGRPGGSGSGRAVAADQGALDPEPKAPDAGAVPLLLSDLTGRGSRAGRTGGPEEYRAPGSWTGRAVVRSGRALGAPWRGRRGGPSPGTSDGFPWHHGPPRPVPWRMQTQRTIGPGLVPPALAGIDGRPVTVGRGPFATCNNRARGQGPGARGSRRRAEKTSRRT
jgi:hypothetical protein